MSDITVGRETVEFLGLRRAILTETVLPPETYAGMKNIEAPFGTVNRIRSGLTTFPLASIRFSRNHPYPSSVAREPGGTPFLYLPVRSPEASGLQIVVPSPISRYNGRYSTSTRSR